MQKRTICLLLGAILLAASVVTGIAFTSFPAFAQVVSPKTYVPIGVTATANNANAKAWLIDSTTNRIIVCEADSPGLQLKCVAKTLP